MRGSHRENSFEIVRSNKQLLALSISAECNPHALNGNWWKATLRCWSFSITNWLSCTYPFREWNILSTCSMLEFTLCSVKEFNVSFFLNLCLCLCRFLPKLCPSYKVDYMTNFSPGWNFSSVRGRAGGWNLVAIRWRISARDEILPWVPKSAEDQNGITDTNWGNGPIASLAM